MQIPQAKLASVKKAAITLLSPALFALMNVTERGAQEGTPFLRLVFLYNHKNVYQQSLYSDDDIITIKTSPKRRN